MVRLIIILGIGLVLCENLLQLPSTTQLPIFEDVNSTHVVIRRSPPVGSDPWKTKSWRLLINELNTDATNGHQFIELKVTRASNYRGKLPTNPTADYVLVIVRATDPPAVVLYLDIGEIALKENQLFIVVGHKDVPNIDITYENTHLQNSLPNAHESKELPNGDDFPYGIMLFNTARKRRISNQFKLIKNTKTNAYIEKPITLEILTESKQILVDMVVYGRRVNAESCGIFDELWPDKFKPDPEHSYILRDWAADRRTDFSLNRCSILDDPFQPQGFKYCDPTPGKVNKCETGFAFYIRGIIDLIAPMTPTDAEEVPGCSTDIENLPPARYDQIDPSELGNLMVRTSNSASACSIPIVPEASVITDLSIIRTLNEEISELRGEAARQPEGDISKFDPEWIGKSAKYLPNKASILYDFEVQKWLRVKISGSRDKPIAFYCDVCLAYSDAHEIDHRIRKDMATAEGYFNSATHFNQKTIQDHSSTELHVMAMKHVVALQRATTQSVRNRLRAEERVRYATSTEPIARMVRTVLYEVFAEIPFSQHKSLVELQKLNGIDMGNLYGSRYGGRKVAEIISKTMHKNLLTHLTTQDKPFSIIVDATTNTQNIPYFIVYIMTLEDGKPFVYFYKIIELREGESSKATFTSFWRAVQEDWHLVSGFKDFFTRRIQYFVSDNAAVMVGTKQSFYTELKSHVGRDLAFIGCFAHKLSLVLKAALRDTTETEIKLITNFETDLNGLYVFYQSRGSKKFQHLLETAEDFNIKPLRFKKNIQVRWAAAEERVVDTILKNHEITVEDLSRMQEDSSFTKKAQETAKELHKSLTDITNILLYHEFADFLTINKLLSLTLQQRAGTLIDHSASILRAFEDYKDLQQNTGKRVTAFLSTCECKNVCVPPACKMKQVEDCEQEVVCGKLSYGRKIASNEKLNEVRGNLYEKLVAALNKYFNIDLIESCRVFDNTAYLSEKERNAADLIKTQFVNVCTFSKMSSADCTELSNEFIAVYNKIFQDAMIMKEIHNAPSKFWPFLINYSSIKMPQSLKEFFEKLLVLPDSSAEAERGFSVLTRLQQGSRAKIEPMTTDALMRIRLNAAKPLADIKTYVYAREVAAEMVDTGSKAKTPKQNFPVSRLF